MIMDHIADLYNAERAIANRTIVLHAIRDDGGKGGFPDSNTTGYLFNMMKGSFFNSYFLFRDAGARIACGVITLSPCQIHGKFLRQLTIL